METQDFSRPSLDKEKYLVRITPDTVLKTGLIQWKNNQGSTTDLTKGYEGLIIERFTAKSKKPFSFNFNTRDIPCFLKGKLKIIRIIFPIR